jgi:fatty-acyl-CoA synthase
MKGLMQQMPLTLPLVFRRAAGEAFGREVVTAPDARAAWSEVTARSLRLCRVLESLGVGRGERVGSLAWNTQRHLELFLAVPCSGRVLHAVNARLHHDQVAWLIEHAGDQVLFVGASLTPLLEPIRERLRAIRAFVVMEDGAEPSDSFASAPRYEELLASEPPEFTFPAIAEDDAATICYTSGTTGRPKGVVTSHRSVVLHTMSTLMADSFAVSGDDAVLPLTPMFHVASWGLPYAAAYAGAKLVLPGAATDADSLAGLIERERVTVACGVPTVMTRLADLLEGGAYDFSSLQRILCGGANVPDSLAERYNSCGIEVRKGWGMTEMSPTGTLTRPGKPHGVATPGMEMRICGVDGAELPRDGVAVGEIEVRGPWIVRAYLDPDDDSNTTRFHDGWLRTGDVGTITPEGGLRLVDRTKDLVKSGGEWIGTVELEELLVGHPDVLEAAVVARPDPEWDERPVAFVVARPGTAPTPDELAAHLGPRVAKWWIPDAFQLLEELPKTSVGKVDKLELRRRAREGVATGP